jgi:hypothetical protein
MAPKKSSLSEGPAPNVDRIRPVRRLLVASLFLAVLVPTALALVFADADWEAIRCAARCGHAVRSGAACCPAGATRIPSFSSCPSSDSTPARIPVLPPSVIAVTPRLTPPSRKGKAPVAEIVAPDSVAPDPPEHVPLALS